MANGTEFDMFLRGIRVHVVVDHYRPPGIDWSPEEFEWHLEALNGHRLTVMEGKLDQDDERAVFDRYVKEMGS
jgi:DNA polymerase III sliding clamp (beta) subunit (PCNA family)